MLIQRAGSRSGAKSGSAATLSRGDPKVYFEEWDEPMISGIRWVSELVEIAGGEDIFPELSRFAGGGGTDRRDGEASDREERPT